VACLLAALWAAPASAGANLRLFTPDTLEVTGDFRLVAIDGEKSWVDGGFGELRSGSDGDLRIRPELGNVNLIWQPQFTWSPDAASGRSANALVTMYAYRAVYRPAVNPSAMAHRLMLFAAGLGLSAPLVAAPLAVRLVDQSGRPVRDAVVTFYPAGAAARPARAGGRFVVSQKNLQFHSFLTVVPVGSDVSFPNFDPTKHHVYSFSPAKKFELKLFARDQSRTVHFDKPGVVALGCNIHDQMSAFIVVTDSAWTARTNARGIAAFGDAPGARGRLTVWQPYLRVPGGLVQQAVAEQQRNAAFSIRLRPPPPMLMADY
jgi:plastocyanin